MNPAKFRAVIRPLQVGRRASLIRHYTASIHPLGLAASSMATELAENTLIQTFNSKVSTGEIEHSLIQERAVILLAKLHNELITHEEKLRRLDNSEQRVVEEEKQSGGTSWFSSIFGASKVASAKKQYHVSPLGIYMFGGDCNSTYCPSIPYQLY